MFAFRPRTKNQEPTTDYTVTTNPPVEGDLYIKKDGNEFIICKVASDGVNCIRIGSIAPTWGHNVSRGSRTLSITKEYTKTRLATYTPVTKMGAKTLSNMSSADMIDWFVKTGDLDLATIGQNTKVWTKVDGGALKRSK